MPIGAITAIGGAAAIAQAAIPSGDGTINGCYSKAHSLIRVDLAGQTQVGTKPPTILNRVSTSVQAQCPAGKVLTGGNGDATIYRNGVPVDVLLNTSSFIISSDTWLLLTAAPEGRALAADEKYTASLTVFCVKAG